MTTSASDRKTRRFLSQLVHDHYCTAAGEMQPMRWRPADLVMEEDPRTTQDLEHLLPATAAHCTDCGELWVLVMHD